MITQNRKGISAVIATIMLLMITVSLIGVFYVFSSTLASQTTSSGSAQASQLTSQLAMCMQIDNIIGNQITLRNCGKGVIENKSLVVMMGDVKLGASTATIQEGNSSVVNVSGLWQVPFGKHNMKISNGAAVALALVDVQPNKDGLVGSWDFNEGQGNKANDGSGNNNIGTLLPAGSEPVWTSGKFGKGLQFDGSNDYVDAGNGASLNTPSALTVEAWIYKKANTPNKDGPLVSKSATGSFTGAGDWELSFGWGNDFYLWTYTGSASTSVSNDINNWHNIIGVYDGSTIKIYVDAQLKTSSGASATLSSNSQPLWIGRAVRQSAFFNGTIDEVRIWNKSFVPDETVTIKQII